MQTEQLIKALAADASPLPALGQRIAAAAMAGFAISALLFVVVLGPRPSIAEAFTRDPRLAFKFAVVLALALSAAGLGLRLLRPGAATGWWRLALLAAPALLMLAIVYELATVDPSIWLRRLVGNNPHLCVIVVPILAAPILIALTFAMRAAAPTQPALAGAVAGLASAGLAAALYAAHCTDDSPLFVMTWYGIAIAMVAIAGALIGARFLRW
jgi:hypothetical protein